MKSRDDFDAAVLIKLFDQCFRQSQQTCLVGGADEPLYQPASHEGECHQVIFRADYFASALHEIAHWCLAGKKRRQQLDYGYWYEGGERSEEAQARFQAVEARPQALEWIFSEAAGFPFRVSNDNLGLAQQSESFNLTVQTAARELLSAGLPRRAARFAEALHCHFHSETDYLNPATYQPPPP